jgi:hypothetical protein
METFLTPAEVEKLTGRKKAKAQLRQLARQGIRAFPDANGKPVVLRASLDESIKSKRRKEPNWDAISVSKTSPH